MLRNTQKLYKNKPSCMIDTKVVQTLRKILLEIFEGILSGFIHLNRQISNILKFIGKAVYNVFNNVFIRTFL